MWGSEMDKAEFAALYPWFNGTQEERNLSQGIRQIKKMAASGYVPAVYQLGLAYMDHLGVRRDYSESFRLYMMAALDEYPSAMAGVGNYYAIARPKHEACAYDPKEAIQWWLKASERGNAGSQCNLAGYYLSSTGAEKNPQEAYVWASMAVHCSSIRFRSAEVFRDQALAMLNEIQIEEANARIQEMKGRLPYPYSDHGVYWRSLYDQYKTKP